MAGTILARIPKGKSDEVRIALENYHGRDCIDLRQYIKIDPSGEIVASKKGISLPVGSLPALLAGIQDAHAEAVRLGLLITPKGN
jgi:hypothetical protein